MQKSTTIIGVLTMLEDSYSYRDIHARFLVGNSTITDLKRKFEKLNISLEELSSKNAQTIETLFYGNSHPKKNCPMPDFKSIYHDLSDKNKRTNLYFLWMDYKKKFPNGYQYTQFKTHFHKWLDEHHLEQNLTMLVERVPGEIVFIDWIGDTLELVLSENPGELLKAHFFVTTVGVSNYCFAMAFPNEKADSFLQGTVEALEFYGCVPKILKPDNTKAASIKNTKDVLVLNRMYEDLQSFYNFVIVPAPPLKPRAKSTVENHVRWLETHLLGKLKGRYFVSFKELNEEISLIMDELNTRPFQKGKGNRKLMFEEYDKKAMKPLPKDSFTQYSYIIRTVPNNYHLEYDGHYYSVPFSYYKQEVIIKASFFDIKICDSMNNLICTHQRAYKPYPKYITITDHMPVSHQYYYTENRYDATAYKNWAKNIGEPMYILICRVVASFAYEEQAYKSCNAILQLCKDVPKTYANTAAKECTENNIVNYSHFKKRLNNLVNSHSSLDDQLPKHKNIRGKKNYE